jgi:hypothetical protein
MAKAKMDSIRTNNLALPSLALSMLVLLLVALLLNIPKPVPQETVSAHQEQLLTNGQDNNSLDTDLVLLDSENFSDLELLFSK